MKKCLGCKLELPLEEFYKARGIPRPRCKKCHAKQGLQWKASNPEKVKSWVLRYQKAHPEKARVWNNAATRKWKAANKDKRVAQHKISNSIRDKKLLRQECVVCTKLGLRAPGQAHHSDYNRPLDVTWLCHKHHRAWHKVFIAEEKTEQPW